MRLATKQKIKYTLLTISVVYLSFAVLPGCKKTDKFFAEEYNFPEVEGNYLSAYGVGDTLVMKGRLNPENGLKVHIGDADAVISSEIKIPGVTTPIDQIKMVITAAMGIGTNRTVSITSDGHTIQGPSIEIYATAGYVTDSLTTEQIAVTVRSNFVFLYCQNGKGSVYFYDPVSKNISLTRKAGAASVVLAPANLKDVNGTFTITTFNGGGVDPQEQWLYFSAQTTDASADNATNAIFRLCKFNLQTGQLITLNRTLYPNQDAQKTLASAQPFEGAVGVVKIYQATGFFPDSVGNVYVRLGGHATCLLAVDGNFKYLFKHVNTSTPVLPKITKYNTDAQVLQLLPGQAVAENPFAMAPNDGLMYCNDPTHDNYVEYDLTNVAAIYTFLNNSFGAGTSASTPYIIGSFDLLTGDFNINGNTNPSRFGLMPLPNERLVLLYYQTGVKASGFPAWGVLDFAARRGLRYAPGAFQIGNLQFHNSDQLLNYDENGVLYMTANGETQLIRTKNQ